jgi:hypothetical protein
VAVCLALGIWAKPLIQLAQDTSAWIQQPRAYVQAVLKQDAGVIR